MKIEDIYPNRIVALMCVGDGLPDLYEITYAMDPKDNGTNKFEFNYSIIEKMHDSWNSNILLNSTLFDTADAFIPTSEEGNASRGPDGDLDNDTLTNYEEYSYNMPDDYDITISGPYDSHISPIKARQGVSHPISRIVRGEGCEATAEQMPPA